MGETVLKAGVPSNPEKALAEALAPPSRVDPVSEEKFPLANEGDGTNRTPFSPSDPAGLDGPSVPTGGDTHPPEGLATLTVSNAPRRS